MPVQHPLYTNAMFQQYDANNDGNLMSQEFATMVNAQYPGQFTFSQIPQLFQRLDSDNDGRLVIGEVVIPPPMLPPGYSVMHSVVMSLRVQGDASTFNATAFDLDLAALLNIDPAMIDVNVSTIRPDRPLNGRWRASGAAAGSSWLLLV